MGYPGVKIDAAFVDLPGGGILELLDYKVADKKQGSEWTANPGNVHICINVENTRSAWERAVASGARPVVPEGPVEVDAGPNKGAVVAYPHPRRDHPRTLSTRAQGVKREAGS